ncbi:hypothetical protein Cgig2_008458 [Carnegiea gigantea]|uniref:Uncharacterized protein n=1 Tax=Carnegiea gigantea TaxID=171969 RepID=A0A9Q1Q656_9CARY|nr:hypothetical protein Cgig2_008458 [Carnegiea gigantea]
MFFSYPLDLLQLLLPSSLFLCLALLVSAVVACIELLVKELGNTIEENKKVGGKDIRDLVVHYKDKVIRIMDVEIENYNCIKLFRDVRASAKESDVRSKYIPIYMYDMKKPSDNQKHVENLNKISASVAQSLPQIVVIASKKNVRIVSGVEDFTNSQANIWADSLIVSLVVAPVKPMAYRPVTRSVTNFSIKPTPSSQSRPCESLPQPKSTSLKKLCKHLAKPTSTFSPKPTAKARPPAEGGRVIVTSVDDNPPSDDDSEDDDFVVDGEDVDDSEDVSLDEENNSSKSGDDEQLKVQVEQRMQLGAEIIDNDADRDLVVNKMARTLRGIQSQKPRGIIKVLRTAMPTASRRTCVIHYYKNFTSLYLGARFHAFFYIAVNTYAPFVYEKAIGKIREKDPGVYHWLRDNEKLELWARFKFDTNLKCDDNTNNFVESFNHAIVRFRGLPILTMLEEIRKLIGSRCKTCKQLDYNAATCGRPRDEHGRLLTKRKRRPIEGRVPKPRGRPKKQKAATLTPTPSATAAVQAGPSTQCSQVGASQTT